MGIQIRRTLLPFVAALVAAAPLCRAAGDAPVVQATQTVGLEVEGLLSASCVGCTLHEKFEAAGPEGVTYELDQVDRASAKTATAEVVTVPKAQSKAGLQALLTMVANAHYEAPRSATFSPPASGDFQADGRAIDNVKFSKGNGNGAAQTNLTIPASKLVPDDDKVAATRWTKLTNEHAKVLPLVKGARELTDLLAKDGGTALHGYWAQKDRVRLWMFVWLSRLSMEVGAGAGVKGYYKDHHGYTIKIKMDPVSCGLDAAAGVAFSGLTELTTPKLSVVIAKAKEAVGGSVGAPAVAAHWPAHPLTSATAEEALATERPLAARLVGGVLSPIVELRQTNSPFNQAVGNAISATIKGGKPKIATNAGAQADALNKLLTAL